MAVADVIASAGCAHEKRSRFRSMAGSHPFPLDAIATDCARWAYPMNIDCVRPDAVRQRLTSRD